MEGAAGHVALPIAVAEWKAGSINVFTIEPTAGSTTRADIALELQVPGDSARDADHPYWAAEPPSLNP